ncbi:hypothetical protein ACFL21_01705 [Patescibacteria group bacterium]
MSTKIDSQNFDEDLDVFRGLINDIDSENDDVRVQKHLGKMQIVYAKKLLGIFEEVEGQTDDLNELRRTRNSVLELISGLNIFLAKGVEYCLDAKILRDGEIVLEELFFLQKVVINKIDRILSGVSLPLGQEDFREKVIDEDQPTKEFVEEDQEEMEIEEIGEDFLKVGAVKLEQVFVPAGVGGINESNGCGGKFEKPGYVNRIALVYEVLRELGVKKCMLFEGCNHPSMMRELSYQMVVVPELDRVILVCEEHGNQTFVREGITDLPAFFKSTKDELKVNSNVRGIYWQDPGNWKKVLKIYLKNDFVQRAKNDDVPEEKNNISIDESYYKNPNLIRINLERFAEKCGLESPIKLKAYSGFVRKNIELTNGEELVFKTYLINVGKALGVVKNYAEGNRNFGKLFREIMCFVGFEIKNYALRDKEYFLNPQNVKADLDKYAKKVGLSSSSNLINKLSSRDLKIRCCNGEMVKFSRYVSNAGVELGIIDKAKNMWKNGIKIINTLLQIAGYEVVDYAPRDKKYYSDPEIIRNDLDNFAVQFGLESPKIISTVSRYLAFDIDCSNGERIKFCTYLNHAVVALGFVKKVEDAQSFRALIIRKLLEIAGYEIVDYAPRDTNYYKDPNKIKKDLEILANQCGLKSPLNLSTSARITNEQFKCSTGEELNFRKYLGTAGVALGFCNYVRDSHSFSSQIIKELLRTAGFEQRDESYYSNSENVRKDLDAFAEQCGLDDPLKINSRFMEEKIECVNGEEEITFRRYICNAGVALGMVKNNEEALSKRFQILRKLFRIAGYKIEEYAQRDKDYYSNPKNVKEDLETFVQKCGLKSPIYILVSNKFKALEIKCSNGEEITFGRYLSNAGVALEIVNSSKEAASKMFSILKELLKIAGYKIEEYTQRDKDYYSNPKNVKKDLENFAKKCGLKSPIYISISNKFKALEIKCSNGEEITFRRYLSNAGIALEIVNSFGEARAKMASILKELLKIVGYEIEEYAQRDESYYSNSENVRKDLDAFAERCGLDDPLKITTSLANKDIICSNGEEIIFRRYICNAGVALEIVNSSKEAASKMASILKELLKIAEYLE